MDVKTVFLNGTLEEELFIEIYEGLDVGNLNRKEKVCKVIKSLCGKIPKQWYKIFTIEAQKLGLEKD